MTGLISFIPYFGMLLGTAVALIVVISQYGEFLQVVIVLVVFGIGQVIESMFLTPRLVGEKVGLHGVWVIFALMVGGGSFGFTGLLLAVPVAATIGVLVRFAITRYLGSTLYSGHSTTPPAKGWGRPIEKPPLLFDKQAVQVLAYLLFLQTGFRCHVTVSVYRLV